MSKTPKPSQPNATPATGDRIAKVLARAGVASRREAERMIAEGRVAVDGKVLTSPALNIMGHEKITVDGDPIAEAEPERVWLYHKPLGLVTTHKDEQGRRTIFDALPEDLPRVMTIGRLDLNSEGLLLLTNDGDVKRKLELPSTGWVRKYRVRVNGRPTEETFAPLRRGIEVDGERFAPMVISLDRQQGANAWVTVSLKEGKNREIRRAMGAIGLTVNRLIRVAYGPFQLDDLKPGAVEELRRRVIRDQLGLEGAKPPEARKTPARRRKPDATAAGQATAPWGDDPSSAKRGKPAFKDGKPTGKGAKPGFKGGKPTSNGGKPPSKNGKPFSSSGKPSSHSGKPTANSGKPGFKSDRPTTKDGKPPRKFTPRKPR